MRKFKDITGKKHGRLIAICHVGFSDSGYSLWKCECECGNKIVVEGRVLNGTGTKSCGCLLIEKNRSRPLRNSTNLKHGHATSKNGLSDEYKIWFSMKQRCSNKNHTSFKNYGGRGISVCERWNSFENFLQDVGYRPSKLHTLDRIDCDGNYDPSNTRWSTWKEQQRNRRNNVFVQLNGKLITVAEASELLNVPYRTVSNWSKKSVDINALYLKWAKRLVSF